MSPYSSKQFLRLFLLVTALFSASSLFAQNGDLSTQLELGAIFTSGNTDNENIQFKATVGYDVNDWQYGFSVDGFRSSQDDVLAAHRVYYVANADYTINENRFISTRLARDDDRFSGYDSQTDFSVNYGMRNLLANRSNMGLTVNVGVGVRQSQSDAEDFTEAMLRLASNYNWDVSETAVFTQSLSAEAGDETSIFRSESAIETKIMDNLSLRFSFNVKHQTEVPIGREKTDTETAITFVLNL